MNLPKMKNLKIVFVLGIFFSLNFVFAATVSGENQVTLTTSSNGITCNLGANLAIWTNISSGVNLTVYNSTGNISGIAINGMNIEISFTTAYTAATANGLYATIDYMTSTPSYSINVANIAMN